MDRMRLSEEEIIRELEVYHTSLSRWPTWLRRFGFTRRISATTPWRIYIRETAWDGDYLDDFESLLPLLNHEICHRHQQGHVERTPFVVLWWFVKYFLCPSFRLRMEMQAYAISAAVRWWLMFPTLHGRVLIKDNELTEDGMSVLSVTGGWSLGGLRSPYFTFGDQERIRIQIAKRAARMIENENIIRSVWGND